MRELEIKVPLKFDLVEFLKFQLGLSMPKSDMTDTHKTMLCYFYLYDRPIEQLVTDKVFKTTKSAQNYVTDLRKMKMLVGKGDKTKVNPRISLLKEDFKVTLTVIKNEEED